MYKHVFNDVMLHCRKSCYCGIYIFSLWECFFSCLSIYKYIFSKHIMYAFSRILTCVILLYLIGITINYSACRIIFFFFDKAKSQSKHWSDKKLYIYRGRSFYFTSFVEITSNSVAEDFCLIIAATSASSSTGIFEIESHRTLRSQLRMDFPHTCAWIFLIPSVK